MKFFGSSLANLLLSIAGIIVGLLFALFVAIHLLFIGPLPPRVQGILVWMIVSGGLWLWARRYRQ